jgi:hypothetical protein
VLGVRRVLKYAIISRKGQAVRLSYDHKGSDPTEAQRIVDAGGFVVNNRVNGVLAVTRALGDASLKEWVVGNPYTTETVLEETDDTLILACDGVSNFMIYMMKLLNIHHSIWFFRCGMFVQTKMLSTLLIAYLILKQPRRD